MSYFEHIVVGPDEATLKAAFSHLIDEGGDWACAPFGADVGGVKFITKEAKYGPEDDEGVRPVVEPQERLPGYFLVLGLPALDPLVTASPACRIVLDRAAMDAGEADYRAYTAPDFDEGQFAAVIRSEPVIAGVNYPFGGASS